MTRRDDTRGDAPEPQARDGAGASDRSPGRKIRPRLEVVDTSGEPGAIREPPVRTVLLVESDPGLRARVRESLPPGYELVTAQAGEAGLLAARLCGPDLILFDPASGGEDTLSRLQSDPLTNAIPIIPMLGPGAPDVQTGHPALLAPVSRPINPVELRGRIIAAVEGPGVRGEVSRVLGGDLGGATLGEVVDLVRKEIGRWVLDAAGPDADDVKIELGGSGQLMGALWSFIARLRDVASKGSRGRISFRDQDQGERISMLTLPAAGDVEDVRESDVVGVVTIAEGIERLRGLRALVADDDPKVRWAFTTLLAEVGMEVEAVADGAEALVAAGRTRPDVVITDILMPGMDGWELIRRLRRDVLLRDVPVVVLSWKEDLLQRMRELEVDADEYMRKELDRDQVLLRIAGVLAARRQIEDRLEEDEIAGRVEATGIVPVLQAVARVRGDARLVVRDTSNVYEVDFHEGRVVRVVTTSARGRRATGLRALSLLLGVSRGRFVVNERAEEIETNLETDLTEALLRAAAPVHVMIEQVAGGAILRVSRLELDREAIDEYLALVPHEVHSVIERLREGVTPRELILSSICGPQELEQVVLDLIRRGAVERIEAPRVTDELRPSWSFAGRGTVPGGDERRSGPSSLPGDGDSRGARWWVVFALIVVAALFLGYLVGWSMG
jgi:CheY-like chemotaxis protein